MIHFLLSILTLCLIKHRSEVLLNIHKLFSDRRRLIYDIHSTCIYTSKHLRLLLSSQWSTTIMIMIRKWFNFPWRLNILFYNLRYYIHLNIIFLNQFYWDLFDDFFFEFKDLRYFKHMFKCTGFATLHIFAFLAFA